LLQKSKLVQLVMPFTLEVGNLWRVMGDMVRAKDIGGLALLFTANFALNKGMEETRGSAVTFDPIDAMIDASNEDISAMQKVGRLGGEVLTNLPAGQFLAGLYPEYGEVGGFKGPTREELFGDRNPQRFGTGLVSAEAIKDPLFKLLPPFGGNQLKKSLEGLEVAQNEGKYKNGDGFLNSLPFMGETKELNYPVDLSFEDKLKMALFGPSATDNAQEYYDNERRPLSEKQTEKYHRAKANDEGQQFYDDLMKDRRIKTIKREVGEVKKDETLSEKERKQKLEKLLDLLRATR
jgi:hypothetical protein